MGNVFSEQRFFTVPVEFVDSGSLRDISPSAVRLYVALCYFAQKHTAVTLQLSNAELRDNVSLDPKSIQSARKELRNHRLIDFEKGALGVYSYILRNSSTGERLPPPVGRKGIRRYHSPDKTPISTQSVLLHSPTPAIRDSNPSDIEKSGKAGLGSGFQCYNCKGTEFWTRDRDRVCSRCHPNPRLPLTAKDLGF
jgi:hypothetical protein